jgi:hypothetical protein
VTNARSRLGTRLVGAGLLLALVACSDETPTSVPTPASAVPSAAPSTPPPGSLVMEGEEPVTAPTGKGTRIVKWDVSLPVSGTLEATIGYLHDDSQIGVWITDRQCTLWQFDRDECFYLTKSLEGPRPRTLRATGVRAGDYSLFVANDGPHDEQIAYRVTLLPGSNGEGRLAAGPAEPPPAP